MTQCRQGQLASRAPCLSTCPLVPSVDHLQPWRLGLVQTNVAEQSSKTSPWKGYAYRCYMLLHINDDIRCGFDANSITNNVRAKHSAMVMFTQDVVVPFQQWTRCFFGHQESYYHAIVNATDGMWKPPQRAATAVAERLSPER